VETEAASSQLHLKRMETLPSDQPESLSEKRLCVYLSKPSLLIRQQIPYIDLVTTFFCEGENKQVS
jgi:hypothetical protein